MNIIICMITVAFSNNDRYWRKNVSQIINCYGVFYLAAISYSHFLPILVCRHFSIPFQQIVSDSTAKSNIYFYSVTFLHYHPQNFPNMDVTTIDTFIIVDHRVLDTEKHNIHDQAWKHQQEWNEYFIIHNHASSWLFYCNCY